MIVKNSLYDRRERVNVDSLLAFDGGNQYASVGVNETVSAAIVSDSFSVVSIARPSATKSFQCILTLREDLDRGYGFAFYFSLGRLAMTLRDAQGQQLFMSNPLNISSALSFVAVTFSANGVHLYFNGHPIASFPYVRNLNIDATSFNLLIGRQKIGGQAPAYFKGFIGNVSVFNGALTEAEIRSIHRHGGLLPESTHEACVAHYVADRQGMVMWDVVGQYNYKKRELGLPELTPYHANLVNFTPTQTEGSQQSAYVDFYTKEISNYQGFSFEKQGSNTGRWQSSGTPNIVTDFGLTTGDFSLEFDFAQSPLSGNDNYLLVLGSYVFYLAFNTHGNSSLLLRQINGQNVNRTISGLWQFGKRVHLLLAYSRSNQTITTYLDGKLSQVNENIPNISSQSGSAIIYGTSLSGAGRMLNRTILFRSRCWNKELNVEEVIRAYENKGTAVGDPVDSLVYHHNFHRGTTIHDLSGNGLDVVATNFPPSIINDFKEKSSLLPPLVNALRFDASKSATSAESVTPNSNVGFIMMYIYLPSLPPSGTLYDLFNIQNSSIAKGMNININSVGEIETRFEFSASQNRTKYSKDGIIAAVRPGEWTQVVWYSDEQFNWGLFLDGRNYKAVSPRQTTRRFFADLRLKTGFGNAILTVGGFDILYASLALSIEKISHTRAIQGYNNSLVRNIPGKLSYGWLPNFNQINDNAGTYTLTDNSPQNHTITLSGFTPPNLNPADLTYSLQSINNLR